MGRRHNRLGRRIGRNDHGSGVRRLIGAGRHLHLRISRIPLRILMRRIRRRRVAIHMEVVITHIGWRRPHVGRASSVRKVLLPSRRHGRLPMGHCGQMMVHVHRLPGTSGKSPWIFQPRVASMGAMRTTLKRRGLGMRERCTRLRSHSNPRRPENASC